MSESEKGKGNVCIVDDDVFLLDMYNLKFQQAGYAVSCFTESAKAVEDLRAHGSTYTALLLDLVMPQKDGYEVLKEVREENLVSDKTVVVVLSNQGQEHDISRAEEYGIDGYLVKANTLPSEVLAYVSNLIEKKRAKH